MKEYLVCEVAFSYGVSLLRARRLTEEEKAHYTEEYRDLGFKPTTDPDPVELKELDWKDVRKVLNNRSEDGSFDGSSNFAYIISEDEWDELLALNQELGKKKILDELEEYKRILAVYEKQEKLYTAEEAKEKRKQYNDAHNEGGEGYVPPYYTIEQYNCYRDRVREFEKLLQD